MSSSVSRFRNVEELRREARRRLPRGVFETLDRGTENEVALAENRTALDAVKLCPRVLVDVAKRRTDTMLFGAAMTSPIAVAPTGAGGLFWYEGDLALARAAARTGVPMSLSTGSMVAMERVAREAQGRLWFQLYIFRDRTIADAMVDRARDAGVEALILTVDTAAAPNREYNYHNGFELPFRISSRNAFDVLARPGWCAHVLLRYMRAGGLPRFENLPAPQRVTITQGAQGGARPGSADWRDVQKLRDRWKGPLILKGILSLADAERAASAGVDAIVVSNHGGRNFDCAPSVPSVLPAIASAVGERLTVLADSGVRRGGDIAKLLALGAKGVLVGRAPLYGLAAAGEPGAGRALDLLTEELSRTMAFLGVSRVDQIDASYVAGSLQHSTSSD